MNIVLLHQTDWIADAVAVVRDHRAVHIRQVLRAQVGDTLRVGLLGKKGRLSGVLGAMGKLPGDERPLIGQRANVLKDQVQALLSERLTAVNSAAMAERIARESLDVTAPCSYTPPGHRHPLISTIEEITDIFAGLGYRVEEGPEIESDYYNFTALNIPPHHPARDMQDNPKLVAKVYALEEEGKLDEALMLEKDLNLGIWRKAWADYSNRFLEEADSGARIDHRTLAAQAVAREPTPNIGFAFYDRLRGFWGHVAERVQEFQARAFRNEMREQLETVERRRPQLMAEFVAMAREYGHKLFPELHPDQQEPELSHDR